MTKVLAEMRPGDRLQPVSRSFSVDMFMSGDVKTIHNDVAAAQREGLEAPIAVGPQVAALIFKMMRQSFGSGWIAGGRTQLTFRRPTPVDQPATAHGSLSAVSTEADGSVRMDFDVWVELPDGEKCIVGTASGLLRE